MRPTTTTSTRAWRQQRLERQTLVWVVLLIATLVTAVLGLEQVGDHEVVGIALLGIGFSKVRLVGLHFMELREAPWGLRAVFEAYVVGVLGALVCLYLLG